LSDKTASHIRSDIIDLKQQNRLKVGYIHVRYTLKLFLLLPSQQNHSSPISGSNRRMSIARYLTKNHREITVCHCS